MLHWAHYWEIWDSQPIYTIKQNWHKKGLEAGTTCSEVVNAKSPLSLVFLRTQEPGDIKTLTTTVNPPLVHVTLLTYRYRVKYCSVVTVYLQYP